MIHSPTAIIRTHRIHRYSQVPFSAKPRPLLRGNLTERKHEPIMVREILDLMDLKPGGIVVDGTLGLGGHALRFVERIRPGGVLVGFDWDGSMLATARERLAGSKDVTLHFVHDDFRTLPAALEELELTANGILLDLGINSAQVDDPERGMSFSKEGPLDMRMDRTRGEPAAAWLNRAGLAEIEQALFDLGDERWARAIARKIIERRKDSPLETTQDLVDCVLAAIPAGARDKRIHPATRTFQAVRMVVNRELEGLGEAMIGAARSLKVGGVLAILSFHSGEDRIAKQVMKDLAGKGFEELTRKPISASEDEVRRNPRSRSAKLRAVRRVEYGVI